MAKPNSSLDAIMYYLSPTILLRSIKRQGPIATVKSGIWIVFHSQINLLVSLINNKFPVFSTLPDNELTVIEDAYYFPRSGILYVPEMGFVDPLINKSHTIGRFILSIRLSALFLTIFTKNLAEYRHVYVGNHVHGPVYGHFIQQILSSHLGIVLNSDYSRKMITNSSQIRFIESYNNSVLENKIDYFIDESEICRLKDVALYPVQTIDDQKKKLDLISWAQPQSELPDCVGRIILRRGAFERRIVNIDEVLTMLKKFGIEPLIPENNDINQNISALKNSDIIIAPKGSGLIDCFFLDSPLVLVFTGLVHSQVFEDVVEIAGGSYHEIKTRQKHTDFVVNLQHLENKLVNLGFKPLVP
jgi:hypothetical protein